ncbi:MAG: hypothetical protein HETSPECPRED_008495 [Heterodermia speciosa]|uniref:Microbial-type PARG catalytic domain-containing protein n=1 Tax=Heterodermia speciosa TaxID=116794 RepID=A0A8H3FYE4_9LECA|nr:MAG: hypothetical protein HETSPECPRED_008495 [Heterodermia speciosa]
MAKNSASFTALNKASRAKLARETINQTIPKLLSSDAKARLGVQSSELIINPPAIALARNQDPPCAGPRIRISNTDTLTAAALLQRSKDDPPLSKRSNPRTCILNMASALRPGGGVLNGANSQEEFLCLRTTLYPSLREDYYRLPEVGVVYTPDVLVFRDANCTNLPKSERYFVDVISAAMIRAPDTTEDGTYSDPRDVEAVIQKMRAVMRVIVAKGARRVVLGAWGCGAFSNPVGEVARLWKKTICGVSDSGKAGKMECWTGVEQIVFAITDKKMVEGFEKCFDGLLTEGEETIAGPSEDGRINDEELPNEGSS